MSVFRANSRALITGGASGIGYAVAELCLKASMKVTIVDYNETTLDLKGDVDCIKSDVSDLSAWKNLREQVGDVDFLMLNAARIDKGTWGEPEYFEKVNSTSYTVDL
jgi:NAD(P)-dependent dehydrogenase (short-subunit alcohol dehydrogenase family)